MKIVVTANNFISENMEYYNKLIEAGHDVVVPYCEKEDAEIHKSQKDRK